MDDRGTSTIEVLAVVIALFGLGVIAYGVGWGTGGDALLGLFVTALGLGVAAYSNTGR